jgi:hypothetical protein
MRCSAVGVVAVGMAVSIRLVEGLARAGWEKPEIAFLMGLDEPAFRRRLDAILAKLGADDLTGALAIAVERNIIR